MNAKISSLSLTMLLLLTIIVSVMGCGPGRGIGGPRRSRRLTPLVFKQHVPNVSENTLGASGLQEGRITRNHDKFKDLETNYNRDIIFKDEEGTGADRVMSQRCKERLDTLAVSVMNQWPGVRLRVTEAWDEEGHHGLESLHYEGRAVDVMTSDRDRSKNGMLARLAVEAGFDWVYYESRAHVHCSVKSDSSQSSHTSGCFSANSTVLTASGETRRLSELKLGEKVLSMDAQGNAIFSEVILFLDRNEQQNREFVRIQTSGGASMTVTPGHLVLVWKPLEQTTKYIFADRVEEGDFLLVHADGVLAPRKVTAITAEIHKGFYAPLTYDGTIVVNNITASCYALVESHTAAHASFMPFRAANSIKHWLGGASVTPTASQQNGIHWYAKALNAVKEYCVPTDWLYKT